MATSYRRIEAVNKAAQILKYLAKVKEPAPGSEIAAAVNLPVGTTMCHLATLGDHGFVRQIGGDGWEIGLGLALIHARVRANLEGERDRIDSQLEQLGGGN